MTLCSKNQDHLAHVDLDYSLLKVAMHREIQSGEAAAKVGSSLLLLFLVGKDVPVLPKVMWLDGF